MYGVLGHRTLGRHRRRTRWAFPQQWLHLKQMTDTCLPVTTLLEGAIGGAVCIALLFIECCKFAHNFCIQDVCCFMHKSLQITKICYQGCIEIFQKNSVKLRGYIPHTILSKKYVYE